MQDIKATISQYDLASDEKIYEITMINELLDYSINQLPGGKAVMFDDVDDFYNKKPIVFSTKDIYNLVEKHPNIFFLDNKYNDEIAPDFE